MTALGMDKHAPVTLAGWLLQVFANSGRLKGWGVAVTGLAVGF